jgi:hypothetical protein
MVWCDIIDLTPEASHLPALEQHLLDHLRWGYGPRDVADFHWLHDLADLLSPGFWCEFDRLMTELAGRVRALTEMKAKYPGLPVRICCNVLPTHSPARDGGTRPGVDWRSPRPTPRLEDRG